ncbi:MAG TPA: M23 family metallopeptidase [Candidatus Babeliaceae bacterium]|nr:M23 family metallopeptidase [Candidatus Babeliaceae bacterium]
MDIGELPVINRDPDYLKESAIAFARDHRLEREVAMLYDKNGVGDTGTTKVHSKKTRKKIFNTIPTQKWHRLIKEAYLSWPLERKSFWLSSPFGPRKKPNGTIGFHTGIDLAAMWGTPVKSAQEGTVVEARYAKAYGNTIVITHSSKFKTRYAHLAKIEVNVGQKVFTGQRIGTVGDTGNVRKKGTDASHLHFEVYVFGKRVNPLHYLTA